MTKPSRNALFPAVSPEARREPAVNGWIAACIVGLYASSQIALAIGHDPWIDEAQAWLQAITLAHPLDFFIVPGEGHPPLWYWLLRLISLGTDFNHARVLTLGIALLNAVLLARLLRGHLLTLAMMLGTFVVLQFWGYQFRPYGLVFTCLITALLLDRRGHSLAATWILAIACGLHFFAGFLFAFWLAWQWQRGTALKSLVPPALLALAFGAMAIISGLGNQTVGVAEQGFLAGIVQNLAWAGMITSLRGLPTALLTFGLLIYALRRTPVLLAVLLALLVTFAIATAAIYGKYPWHTAFMTMLCFMAFMVAGLDRQRELILAIVLMPQVVVGLIAATTRLQDPVWQKPDLYAAMRQDAGPQFHPETDLVAWPDLAGIALAAENGISIINGNDGTLLGPVQWRTRQEDRIDPSLTTKAGPYWLICTDCAPILDVLTAAGRQAKLLAAKANIDNGEFYAYRVE